MASTSVNQDVSADPIYVTRAEADLALDRFPTENPFKHLDASDDVVDAFEPLTVELAAPVAIDTVAPRVAPHAAPRPGSARTWVVAGVILLGAAYGVSLKPLGRTATDVPAPEPTFSSATLAPPAATPPAAIPSPATPAPATPPLETSAPVTPAPRTPTRVEPPPVVSPRATKSPATSPLTAPSKTQPVRADVPPSTTRVPPPPSTTLAIATDARLLAAEKIALGEITAPPNPSSGTRATNSAPAPGARGTTAASPPPPVAPAPASPRDGSADASAVQAIVDRYARALSDLDVESTGTVWPDVDAKALTRSFERLDRQSIVFSGCQISVTDAVADASCAGQTRYVPKIGRKTERVESHQWTFTLRKLNGRWLIMSVHSK